MNKAALIGKGEIGLAIGSLLEKNGIDHPFWDKDPERSTGELPDVLSGADAVFFCIPSWALREALSSAKDHLKGDEILVFISKGLESGTGLNAPEMASEIFPDAKIVFLGGPMIAEEVVSGRGGAGVSASRHSDAAEIVRKAISSEGFFVEISEDVGGAAFAGVMKNIYAMVIGASAGVGYGVNVKGLVMRKALSEMGKVIALLGGKEVPSCHYTEESAKKTVVPNRNMIMLSIAAGYAEAHEIPEIFYAAHKNDSTIYPDCRPEFVLALRPAIRLGTAWHPVELQAPFVDMTKAEIVKMGVDLEVPYEMTWSCYKGEDRPCRTCPTCIEREEAFAINGMRDPLAV